MMKYFLLCALVLVFPAPGVLAQHGSQPMHQRFDDAERWAKVFDDPARDAWQKPDEVIRALRLPAEAAVADLGAGTGYFAVRLARALRRGRVYGADLEPEMVRYLNARAEREKLANLRAHLAAANDPKIPAPVDLVLVVDTYHHIGHRMRYFSGLKKSLKPGGRLAIVDFRLDSPVGPPARHRVAPQKVVEEMAQAGYRLAEEHGFLPYQYFLLFEPR